MARDIKIVLVLAAHTDDGEFGCGGTIAKLLEQGCEIVYVAFSVCRTSLPPNLDPDTLMHECRAATQSLGVTELVLFDYEVRRFPENRQAILDDLVKLQKRFQPNLVFVPASSDIHQDHQVMHNEAKRAFKYASTVGYELPWNNIVMTTNLFSPLTEAHLEAKIRAVKAYRSQSFRHYYRDEFVRSQALMRGVQAGVAFAEAFEVVRWSI